MPKLINTLLVVSITTVLSFTALQVAAQTEVSTVQIDTADLKKTFAPLTNHMESRTLFPALAWDKKTPANVVVQFELTAEGTIGKTEFLNDKEVKNVGNGLGTEAIRTLKLFVDKDKVLPPGTYILPVTFLIDKRPKPKDIDPELLKRVNCLTPVTISAGSL